MKRFGFNFNFFRDHFSVFSDFLPLFNLLEKNPDSFEDCSSTTGSGAVSTTGSGVGVGVGEGAGAVFPLMRSPNLDMNFT